MELLKLRKEMRGGTLGEKMDKVIEQTVHY